MDRSDAIKNDKPSPRILFVVLSAVAPAATVDQLAKSLAPHKVLVHHDFSQQPQFVLHAPNTAFVPNPVRTGWAVFGLVDAMFHSLRHALAEHDFDYIQLMSPSCLPIKPLAEFEAHVSGPADAHFDCIDLLADHDAFMSVAYRAFTPEDSLRHRITRRLTSEYFGPAHARRDEAGVWLRSGGRRGVLPWIGYGLMKALSNPVVGRHLFDSSFKPYYGSAWFGARRHVARAMVEGFERPGVRDYFSRLRIAEEFLLPTLLMQIVGESRGPMNHYVHVFEEAHAGWLAETHLPMLRELPSFFARKFPNEIDARVRLRVLSELCGQAVEGIGKLDQLATEGASVANIRAAAPGRVSSAPSVSTGLGVAASQRFGASLARRA